MKGTQKGLQGKGMVAKKPQYGDIPPSQTLYVNNLNEKTNIEEMKCCLNEIFAAYGDIADIIAFKGIKKKGQAFIAFREITSATNAFRGLQNFMFLDKPMRIQYALTKADCLALEDGTFKPRKKTAEEEKKAALAPKAKAGKGGAKTVPPPKGKAPPPKAGAAAAKDGDKKAEGDEAQSNVLFVENLPNEVNEMMLTMLFRQYPGFQEARLIKGRNVAFVEYQDELQAGIAMHGLQGFMVTPEQSLRISFAKQ